MRLKRVKQKLSNVLGSKGKVVKIVKEVCFSTQKPRAGVRIFGKTVKSWRLFAFVNFARAGFKLRSNQVDGI